MLCRESVAANRILHERRDIVFNFRKFTALLLAVLVLAACTERLPDPITVGSETALEDPVDIKVPPPTIVHHASQEEIQRWFPGETRGDLYVGEVVKIRIERNGSSLGRIWLLYSNGTFLSPGWFNNREPVPLRLGCSALLFQKNAWGTLLVEESVPCGDE